MKSNSSNQSSSLSFEDSAVQEYVNVLQNIISRFANNSANCKTWCITLVSAMIVILLDKNKSDYIWILFAPITAFWILDSYYLSLENSIRALYNDFVEGVSLNKYKYKDLFKISVKSNSHCLNFCKAFFSISTLLFYGAMNIPVLILYRIGVNIPQ